MKQITAILISTLLSASALAGMDHDGERKHKSPEQRIETLTKKLNLNEEQKPKVINIFKDSHAQRMNIDKGEREKHEALREQTREKLSQVLTGEQMDIMEELHKKRMKKRHQKND